MKLISRTLKYSGYSELLQSASKECRIELCVDYMIRYFDLPPEYKICKEKKKYIISLHTIDMPNALKIKRKYGHYILINYDNEWELHSFYLSTKRILMEAFDTACSDILFVVLEES